MSLEGRPEEDEGELKEEEDPFSTKKSVVPGVWKIRIITIELYISMLILLIVKVLSFYP
jgi:hypothetical protein